MESEPYPCQGLERGPALKVPGHSLGVLPLAGSWGWDEELARARPRALQGGHLPCHTGPVRSFCEVGAPGWTQTTSRRGNNTWALDICTAALMIQKAGVEPYFPAGTDIALGRAEIVPPWVKHGELFYAYVSHVANPKSSGVLSDMCLASELHEVEVPHSCRQAESSTKSLSAHPHSPQEQIHTWICIDGSFGCGVDRNLMSLIFLFQSLPAGLRGSGWVR